MPCYTHYPTEEETLKEERDKYKRDLDKATRLLCEIGKSVARDGDGVKLSKEMINWYESHFSMDKDRVAKECRDILADSLIKIQKLLKEEFLLEYSQNECLVMCLKGEYIEKNQPSSKTVEELKKLLEI